MRFLIPAIAAILMIVACSDDSPTSYHKTEPPWAVIDSLRAEVEYYKLACARRGCVIECLRAQLGEDIEPCECGH